MDAGRLPTPNPEHDQPRTWVCGGGVGRWELGVANRVLTTALSIACAITLSACGKKGPPLAPFVHIPAAIDKISAERVGSDVYVKVIVPAQNIDASKPADVARVD